MKPYEEKMFSRGNATKWDISMLKKILLRILSTDTDVAGVVQLSDIRNKLCHKGELRMKKEKLENMIKQGL